MDKYEQKIVDIIDKNRDLIIDFGRDIYTHAELGFKEFRTGKIAADFFENLGLDVQRDIAITGSKATINEDKKNNFHLAVLGELDALLIPKHKYAVKETGAAHCCGHHAQITGVIGAALALTDEEILSRLDGALSFMAVPAEEFGEIEFKKQLVSKGKIKYPAGKPEMIAEGAFDDVDLNVVHHLDLEAPYIGNGTTNGFVSKVITYEGKAAHAACAPEKGVNALSAASIGLTALGLNRETFRDEDHVRVHPIMTEGGSLVNVVPDKATLETFVRGGNTQAIEDASEKTDRSFIAGAMAMGAKVTIETMPGYMAGIPMPAYDELVEVLQEIEKDKKVSIQDMSHTDAGSSDLGDLQHFRPVVQFRTNGMTGGTHTAEFDIVDEEEAYINTAKIFALISYRLLRNGAALGKKIAKEHPGVYKTKEEYMAYIDSLTKIKEYDFSK